MARSFLFAAIAVTTVFGSLSASAQSGITENKKSVTSAAARKMVDACTAFAEKQHATFAIAIVDESAQLIEFHAMSGSSVTTIETAILKAKTAARWRRATEELNRLVNTQENRASEWIGDFPQRGGLPIVVDGKVAGAIGVGGGGGGGGANVECAQAAIDAVIGKTPVAAAGR
jgi:glc operon protein GlcG